MRREARGPSDREDPPFCGHGGCGTVILALFPPSNKSTNNQYPPTRVNWPKKAIFRPKSLKTRLQGQSSVLIAPRLGRVTLRETLRYPTPFPFGVSTEADSSTSPLPGRLSSSCYVSSKMNTASIVKKRQRASTRL
jgi:hypothetical protein